MKFQNGEGVDKFLKELFEKVVKEATPVVTGEFVNDSQKGKVPYLTGALQASARQTGPGATELDKGIVIWNTPYARRRYYEGSVSGVAYWDIHTMNSNKNKYKELIIKVYNDVEGKV